MTVRDIRGMSDDFVVFEVGISSKAKKSSKRKTPLLLPFLIYSILLCLVELFLSLLASRTFPVIRQIFQCKAVMLGRIIYISADRAYILSRPFLTYTCLSLPLLQNSPPWARWSPADYRDITRFTSRFSYPRGVWVLQ